MKITRAQLRKVIREACGLGSQDEAPLVHWDRPTPQHPEDELPPLPPITHTQGPEPMLKAPPMLSMPGVPVPEDYNRVRDFLEITPGMNDLTIDSVKKVAKTGCERSTAQGIIDHLKDKLHGMG